MAVLNSMVPAAAQKPIAATDAVATLAADVDSAWTIDMIMYSYSATPTGGMLIIAWGSESITLYISAGGPGVIDFSSVNGLKFAKNVAVTVTLKSGAGAVLGSVYPIASRR